MLSDEVGEERSETSGNVPDGATQRREHSRGRVWVEGNEEDQECDAKPGENLLDHGGPSPPLRVTVIAGNTHRISYVAQCELCGRKADAIPAVQD
jgi:hypothetical protein